MTQKKFLIIFLLSGFTYAILTIIIDKKDFSEILTWGFWVKALIFGFFITLVNAIVRYGFKANKKVQN
jgi:hypothetical protein